MNHYQGAINLKITSYKKGYWTVFLYVFSVINYWDILVKSSVVGLNESLVHTVLVESVNI